MRWQPSPALCSTSPASRSSVRRACRTVGETSSQAQYDQVMPPGAPPLVLFRTVAVSERAWRKFRGGSLLDGRLISLREREILIDRTCALAGCEYEWGVHVTAFARAARLTAAEIAATCSPDGAAETWSEAERALIAVADALHARATLTDDEFTALRIWYDDAQTLEIIMVCGFTGPLPISLTA